MSDLKNKSPLKPSSHVYDFKNDKHLCLNILGRGAININLFIWANNLTAYFSGAKQLIVYLILLTSDFLLVRWQKRLFSSHFFCSLFIWCAASSHYRRNCKSCSVISNFCCCLNKLKFSINISCRIISNSSTLVQNH